MNRYFSLFLILSTLLSGAPAVHAQQTSNYTQVNTYVNPVLPGDHPDPTMLRVGDDFYHCGSSFHFTPYLPIYHSKDMVHWEVISRVVPPTASFVSDRPSAGIWQGAITYFYGSYWIYFSANGQWFSKASSPKGPWSEPVRVKGDPKTGPLGYDNSIFVDDDGKPYMVIKNGQKTNRLQELGRDGQLTASAIDLDWVNAKLQYSWAEGPVMCKRNGYYYYFPAGDVSGGQYAMRGKALTADSTQWERLGDFFKPITDPKTGFRRPNHISAPIQLADGTWWTIGQSYEKPLEGADWSGMGRQTGLYQVIWEGDRPWGLAPTTKPVARPNLPQSGILWRSAQSDRFDSDVLSPNWHFLSKRVADRYSLSARKGWVRLSPDTARVHLMQKETDHYYTAVTRVDLNADDPAAKAGIYLTNGNQKVFAQLYSGFDTGKKIVFRLDTAIRTVPNSVGSVVWLKVERNEHQLTGYYSRDGTKWTAVGPPISSVSLDKAQPNFNSWVGTSIGLFAEGKPADFDFFICKDGFSSLPAVGYSNYYGVEKTGVTAGSGVTNDSSQGGWFMLSGVDLGMGNDAAKQVQLQVSTTMEGTLELWLDDLSNGKKIATIPFKSTTGKATSKTVSQSVKGVSGHHDVFVKFPAGKANIVTVKALQFQK
ncbi:family 43 glycosylhydrolase [Spirosoma linguale]|uniref:Glycoside hydrolase family 43 n=1 Tax=Spirosoma linguale (strain ATCC 33905 / DSM 74 / LMG 10896 / Claus 1) TaxID=504472 RepID=D2QDL3_SPILD|nr:glycoside hydrolase family 43 [Spirosoma linguale DSM 74]